MFAYATSSAPHRLLLILLLLVAACSDDPVSPGQDSGPNSGIVLDNLASVPDWTESTHGKVAPDYGEVFLSGDVKRIDIVMDDGNWQAMLDDMTAKYGSLGSRGRPFSSTDSNPIWVPASVFYAGTQWYQVGVRFKGNSSLTSAWGQGILKLPLKLDFDQFEDEYPQITNQRFWGFKQLALSSGYEDTSMMREKVAADLFREAGVPAAHTSFCRVYIDHGDGPEYFGLYAIVEVVDDTVIEDQFGDDGGNLYKPDGNGASFAAGSFSESTFEKKSNEDESDWSDIQALFAALHAGTRTSDPAAWRSGLESVLDVDGFLKWLAVNTVIQNWDTYGRMTHNYYLYNDPADGRLAWIPWDNNEALQTGKMGGSLPLALSGVSSSWPLIRFLVDDATYRAKYAAYVDETIQGAFAPSLMTARYQALHDLIQPYVTGADGEVSGRTFLRSAGDFDAEVGFLQRHVQSRYDAATAYLQSMR